MSRIKHFWLASYPKSGNTWLRLFLHHLMHPQSEASFLPNSIKVGHLASSRHWVGETLGIEISELMHDEIDVLRPFAYQWHFEHCNGPQQATQRFHKIHDAYRILPNGQPLIPSQATTGALYLMRNPLDIAISGANHASITLDQAIDSLCDPQFTLSASHHALDKQLRQILGSWSNHVSSWLLSDLKKLVVRYEDMSHNPLPTFQAIAHFLDLPSDTQRINAALSNCQFKKIQQQENEFGFSEKAHKVTNFFRKGIVGDWVNHLSDEQVNRVITHHRPMMQRMGYLDDHGSPLVIPKVMSNTMEL